MTRSNARRRPSSAALNGPQQASSELRSPVFFEGLTGTLGLAGGGGGDATPQLPVLSPRNSAVLTGARRCRAFPSLNAWLKPVRGTRGTPKCRLRSYLTRYCPAWSGTPCHRRSCWYVEQAWWDIGWRAGGIAITEASSGSTPTFCGRRFREHASCHTAAV